MNTGNLEFENKFQELKSKSSYLNNMLLDPHMSFSDKLNELNSIKTMFLVPLIEGCLRVKDVSVDLEFDIHYSKLISLLGNIENSLYRKHEYELKEVMDFNNPKIQKAFEFLFQIVIETLSEISNDELLIEGFINNFAFKTIGFEEILKTSFRGISNKAVDNVNNPFVELLKARKLKYSKLLIE